MLRKPEIFLYISCLIVAIRNINVKVTYVWMPLLHRQMTPEVLCIRTFLNECKARTDLPTWTSVCFQRNPIKAFPTLQRLISSFCLSALSLSAFRVQFTFKDINALMYITHLPFSGSVLKTVISLTWSMYLFKNRVTGKRGGNISNMYMIKDRIG